MGIIGFDSDTVYHVDALHAVLSRFPSPREEPYVVSQIVDMFGQSYPAGGAGIAISAKAAQRIGHAYRSGLCAFHVDSSDANLGACAAALRIPMVDVPGF